jgi:hypothetical protein
MPKAKREVQHLTIPLREFQSSDMSDPRGTWSGYANLLGFLENNYGSIFIKGCYVKSIPSFLKNGFVPDSHGAANQFEYTVFGSYGYPTAAREDAKGLYFEGKFHSDEKAQTLRTRIKERDDDGLSVGMSIGFLTSKSFRIQPKDYKTELPKYLAPEFLIQGLADAQSWPSVLIRQEVQLIENSLTLTPAMDAALITEIQSTTQRLSYFEGIEESLALGQIYTLVNTLYYCAAYDCFCNDAVPIEDRRTMWAEALQEFNAYNLKIFDAFSASPDAEDDDPLTTAKSFFREGFDDPKNFSALAALDNKQLGIHALDAIRAFVARRSSLAEHRAYKKSIGQLSGKVVSKTNWESHKAVRDAIAEEALSHQKVLKECIDKMDEFLDKYNPDADKEAESRQSKIREIRMKQIARNLSEHKLLQP